MTEAQLKARREKMRLYYYRTKDAPGAREKRIAVARARWLKLREDMFAILGKVCCGCGETNPQVLTVDHIHGRKGQWGRENSKRPEDGATCYKRIIAEGEDAKSWARILCWNCQHLARWDRLQTSKAERAFPE